MITLYALAFCTLLNDNGVSYKHCMPIMRIDAAQCERAKRERQTAVGVGQYECMQLELPAWTPAR
jgi:hypothetical protein